jgi:hypothetical protein
MLNWPGFLKWSLSHHDNTGDTNIPKMTPEQQKWLEEVVKESSLDQNKQMKATLDQLVEKSAEIEEKGFDKETENVLMELTESLRELLSHLDAGMNFTKMGGVIFLLDKACVTQLPKSFRYQMLSLLMEIAQNNDFVQKMLLNNNFPRIVSLILEDQDDIKMQYRVIGALRAILGGKNVVLKRIFLESEVSTLKGLTPSLEVILNLLMTSTDKNTLKRGFLLLEDLYRYRPYLSKKMDSVPDEKISSDIFPDHEPFMGIMDSFCAMDYKVIEFVLKIILEFFENKENYSQIDLSFKLNFFMLIKSFGANVSKEHNKDLLKMLESNLKNVFRFIIFENKSEEVDPELKVLMSECIKIIKTFN